MPRKPESKLPGLRMAAKLVQSCGYPLDVCDHPECYGWREIQRAIRREEAKERKGKR